MTKNPKTLPLRTRVDVYVANLEQFEAGTVIATGSGPTVLIALDRGGLVQATVDSPLLKISGDE